MELRVVSIKISRCQHGLLYKTHERMRICKRNRPFKKQKPLPHKFEWIEMEIAKNGEEYGLMKTDLSKQKIEDKKS